MIQKLNPTGQSSFPRFYPTLQLFDVLMLLLGHQDSYCPRDEDDGQERVESHGVTMGGSSVLDTPDVTVQMALDGIRFPTGTRHVNGWISLVICP